MKAKKYYITNIDIFYLAWRDYKLLVNDKIEGDIEKTIYITEVLPTLFHKMYEVFHKFKVNNELIDYNVFMSNVGQFCQQMCPTKIPMKLKSGLHQTHSYYKAYGRLKEILKPLKQTIDDI